MSNIIDEQKASSIEQLVLLISGVPGSGKTTISYELLKKYNEFRIIQETDLIREILRGYNEYLNERFNPLDEHGFKIVPDHRKMFNYSELKEQCKIMRNSIENIIIRQQRKKIPSIINGIHIVPEVLNGIVHNNNVLYVNLYIDRQDILYKRWVNRDPIKYLPNISVTFETNLLLYESTRDLSEKYPFTFHNVNVSNSTIEQTVHEIVTFIRTSQHYDISLA